MTLTSLLLSSLLAPVHAASPGTAALCHWDGGGYVEISVSQRAVAAHIAQHGDSLAGAYYPDADGDGYGDPDGAVVSCPNEGHVLDATDCDDADAAVNPGATEIPYDGIDNDCGAGTREDDLDGDGFGVGEDCDDTDATVNPAAEDVCDDGIDGNCDGFIDEACATSLCPCYTEDDLDAAYADWLEAVATLGFSFEPTATCSEVDYAVTESPQSGYLLVIERHESSVLFQAAGWDGPYMDASRSYFYGVSSVTTLDEGDAVSSSAYYACSTASSSLEHDGTTYQSASTSFALDDLSAEEAASCVDLIDAWVAVNGLTCEASP